jgi:hypothetical protein
MQFFAIVFYKIFILVAVLYLLYNQSKYNFGGYFMKYKFLSAVCVLTMLLATPVLAQDTATVVVNGDIVEFDGCSAVIENSSTLIPLRGVFERLGYKIGWNNESKTATFTTADKTITLKANDYSMNINGEKTFLSIPAKIINDRMYLPLRELGEATGLDIAWDSESKTVYIGTADKTENTDNSEIKESIDKMFDYTLLAGFAQGYDETAESTYLENVKDFLTSETIGIDEESKAELLDIIDRTTADDYSELQDFALKMYKKSAVITNTYLRIQDSILEESLEQQVNTCLEKAALSEDFITDMENAETSSQTAKLYADMLKRFVTELDTIQPKSENGQAYVQAYKYLAEDVIAYCDYVQSLDGEFDLMQFVM